MCAHTRSAPVPAVGAWSRFACCALLLLMPLTASAQGQTQALAWDVSAPLSDVLGYQQIVTMDGSPVSGTPSCTGNATTAVCILPLPTLSPGPHTYVIRVLRNSVERTIATTIDTAQGPAPVSGPRLLVTVVVQVGQ